jgi:hypothetical protein
MADYTRKRLLAIEVLLEEPEEINDILETELHAFRDRPPRHRARERVRRSSPNRMYPVPGRHDGTCPVKVTSAVTASISTWMR